MRTIPEEDYCYKICDGHIVRERTVRRDMGPAAPILAEYMRRLGNTNPIRLIQLPVGDCRVNLPQPPLDGGEWSKVRTHIPLYMDVETDSPYWIVPIKYMPAKGNFVHLTSSNGPGDDRFDSAVPENHKEWLIPRLSASPQGLLVPQSGPTAFSRRRTCLQRLPYNTYLVILFSARNPRDPRPGFIPESLSVVSLRVPTGASSRTQMTAYLPHIPNVYNDGRMCLGDDGEDYFETHYSDTQEAVDAALEFLYETPFNFDLMYSAGSWTKLVMDPESLTNEFPEGHVLSGNVAKNWYPNHINTLGNQLRWTALLKKTLLDFPPLITFLDPEGAEV